MATSWARPPVWASESGDPEASGAGGCVLGHPQHAIRTCVSPTFKKGIALRVTSGSSMINDDLSHECLAVDVEDAIRMNADCMAVQTFIGADGQLSSIDNLSRCINAGMRYSIRRWALWPSARTWSALTASSSSQPASWPRWACSSSRPTTATTSRKSSRPAGADRRRRWQKLPEDEALTLAYRSIQGRRARSGYGPQHLQSNHPVEMAKAIA